MGKAPLAPWTRPLVTHYSVGLGGVRWGEVGWGGVDIRLLKNLHVLNHCSIIYKSVVCHCMHTVYMYDTICRTTCHITCTTCHIVLYPRGAKQGGGGLGGGSQPPLNFGWGVEHLSTPPDFEKKIFRGGLLPLN